MTSRNLWYSIGTLVVLLVLWIGVSFFSHTPQTKVSGIDVTNITEKKINYISITSADSEVILVSNDSQWQVGGHYVDPVLLENIWGTFEDAAVSGPVSRNAANHEKFEVDDEQSVVLTFKGAKNTHTLIVGKPATAHQSSYVRLQDSDEVYVFNADLRFLFPTEVNLWRDTVILSLSKENLEQIHVTMPEDLTFVLSPFEDDWIARSDDLEIKVQEAQIDALFSHISPLRADRFIEDESDLSAFEESAKDIHLTLEYKKREGIILEMEEQETGMWWVRVNESGSVYEVPAFRVDAITTLADFLVLEE